MMEGDNQYEHESYGKKDAKKFIRFVELPPVLQISFNRFEFDYDSNSMRKENRRIKFQQELDLDAILPKSDKLTKKKNIYQLLAISIHRGNQQSGHYYAYIRPKIESQEWYQFNDARVTQTTAREALSVGMGGNYNEFEISGQSWSNNKQVTVQNRGDDSANGYMLIYVRKSEIPKYAASSKVNVPKKL